MSSNIGERPMAAPEAEDDMGTGASKTPG